MATAAENSPRLSVLLQSQSAIFTPEAASTGGSADPQTILTPAPASVLPDVSAPESHKKRSRASHYFRSDASYHCLMLKNFEDEQVDMVKDSILDYLAEQQGTMEEDDELPNEDMDVEEIEISRVRILQSLDEQKKRKSLYRKEYVARPTVQEKRKAKENDPEQKAKREKYSKDPQVRERKADCTKERQRTVRLLKDTQPELYQQLRKQASEDLKRQKTSRPRDESSEDQPPTKRSKVEIEQVTPMMVEGTQ